METTSAPPPQVSEDDLKKAEEFKMQGNEYFKSKAS